MVGEKKKRGERWRKKNGGTYSATGRSSPPLGSSAAGKGCEGEGPHRDVYDKRWCSVGRGKEKACYLKGEKRRVTNTDMRQISVCRMDCEKQT